MFKDFFKKYVYPSAVFSGGMIGVGFLSLPFVALKVGIWIMLFYFLVMTGLMIAINSIFCQISLKTPDFKRFPGFVGYYLGKKAEIFVLISTTFAVFGILLAYLIVGSQFLALAFGQIISDNILFYIFCYFILANAIIYFDIKVVAKVEFWVIIVLFLSLLLIFIEGLPLIKIDNILSGGKNILSNLFLPYGPLLFALWGVGLIPEVEEMIAKKKKNLKIIISSSTIIVSIFYFLFTLLVLGITGQKTEETALQGLKNALPGMAASVALLMGALATFIAFITQAMIFKKTLVLDLKIKHWQALVITCCPPLILYLLGLNSFLTLISLVGGVILGINGVLILLMYKKIGGKKIIIYPLSLFFLLGIIYEIAYFIK